MINLQVDKRPFRDTVVKGKMISHLVRLWEVGRQGYSRWPAVKAQGTFTLTVVPSNGETVTIGSKVYTFQTVLTNVDGNVAIGSNLASAQANLVAAINLSGVPGTQYASAMTLNQDVDATAFATNAMVVTAKTGGTAGNSIATTDTCANGSWDAATLGTTRAGAATSDADSTFMPAYRSSYNGSAGNEYAAREMYYMGDYDGSTDRPINTPDLWAAFPSHDYKILAGTTRKIWTPNHFDRRFKHLRALYMRTMTTRPTWISSMVSPFTENTSNTIQKAIAIDATRMALFYYQNGGTTGIYCVIGQINASTGVMTFGTPVLCTALNQSDTEFDAILINTDKVLMAYGAGASTYTQTATLSLSGTTITKNADVQITTTNFTQKTLAKIGTDKAILFCQNSTTLTAYCVSITGTVPSYGTAATIASSNFYWGNAVGNGTDKAQIVYVNNSLVKTAVVTASGTTLTFQTAITIGYETTFNYRQNQLFAVTTDRFVYFHPNGSLLPLRGRSRARLTLITVSGNTSSQITTTSVDSSYFDANGRYFLTSIDSNSFWLYSNRDGASKFRGIKVTTTATTLAASPEWMAGIGMYDDADNGPGNESPVRAKQYNEFGNIQRWSDPVVLSTFTVIIGTDNNVNGGLTLCIDKPFSFDLYVGDNKVGTYQKTANLLVEPVLVSQDLYLDEFGIKIKSNESIDVHLYMPSVSVTIE